ncbi:MAG: hypothetical protein ABL866_14455 [Devosia sp.]
MILRYMKPDGTGTRDIVAFNGGQGTINVNSWARTIGGSGMWPIR